MKKAKNLEQLIEAVSAEVLSRLEAEGYGVRAASSTEADSANIEFFIFEKEFAGNPQKMLKYKELKEKFFKKTEVELERKRAPKRKQHELPDPTKPASASVNKRPTRTTKQFNADISPDTISLIGDFKDKSGLTKREIVERAIYEFVTNHSADYE